MNHIAKLLFPRHQKHTHLYILQDTHTHRHSIKAAWKVMHTWVINSTQYLQIYLQLHFEGAISLTFKVIWKSWFVHTLRLWMSVCSSRPHGRGLIPEMTEATDQKQEQTWDLSSGALGSATRYFTLPLYQHFKWHRHNLAACCQDYLRLQDLTLTVRLKAHCIFLSFCRSSCPLQRQPRFWQTRKSTPTSSAQSRQTTLWTQRWWSSSTTTTGAAWGPSHRTCRGSQRSVVLIYSFKRLHFDM